jgi:adenine/guanine phosphoribosyltransferase-like PRPP-binding protein
MDGIRPGDRAVVIDDVVASGETALATIKLIERANGWCVGLGCPAAFPNWGVRPIVDHGVQVHSIADL